MRPNRCDCFLVPAQAEEGGVEEPSFGSAVYIYLSDPSRPL